MKNQYGREKLPGIDLVWSIETLGVRGTLVVIASLIGLIGLFIILFSYAT